MKNVLFLLTFLFFTTISLSQTPGKLLTTRQLTDSISVIVKQENITGLMVGITTKDSVLFSGGFGFADRDTKRRADENTMFRMGSITKMFVSLGIMKLVNEGKLKLEDELKKIAPEIPFRNNWEPTHPVRIVHLLEHTSAFDDIKLNHLYSSHGKEKTGFDMVLIQQNSLVCRWKPGERFAYSNPNYSVLGYLLEKLSGMPYDWYLTENILNPLGMTSSNFNARSRFPLRDVKEYIVKNGQTIPVESVTLVSGAYGGLWSCSADMVKFLQLFLRTGSPLFPANIIIEIETPHSSLAARSGQKNGYSLGNDNISFIYNKFPFRGHDGLAGNCFSSFRYNREYGVGFVIASNSNNPNYRVQELIVSYLEQNKEGRKLLTEPLDKKEVGQYLGRYQFESPRFMISGFSDKLQNAPEIYIKNDLLFFKPLIGEVAQLVQTAPLTFAWKGMNMPLIRFTKNEEGKKVMLIGGSYFEQTSNFWALCKRILIVIALLFMLSAFITGFVSIIGCVLGKRSWRRAIPMLIALAGIGCLAWAIRNLLLVQQYSYKLSELDTLNFFTMGIFLGTSIYGVATAAGLYFLTSILQEPGSLWRKIYLLCVNISLCLILIILLQNGWIGLRTWAM
ncbi:MAG: serine hydrolase domain-containing protein [Ferruginibacter sp.]